MYIDLDADLKVPATGEGAVDWMGVAHLLDADEAESFERLVETMGEIFTVGG